ncbi:MAG: TIGR03936 family radical SAM-associated protein [Oscillospiraceae bacterium]
MTNDSIKTRIFYTKLNFAKYISHLDVTRCMQRALKRADLPVWYTQGFNPHIYLTFALPLSLGYESECEVMDIRLNEEVPFEEIAERFNAVLPADIRVTKVALPIKSAESITKALYEIKLYGDVNKIEVDLLETILADEILVQKKTKKKDFKIIDIKPDIEVFDIKKTDEYLHFNLMASAGNEKNISPSLLLEKIENVTAKSILRKKLICDDGESFQ